MKREVIRGGVFESGRRLPTVSLEQYAEEQLQEAKERDERQRYVHFDMLQCYLKVVKITEMHQRQREGSNNWRKMAMKMLRSL